MTVADLFIKYLHQLGVRYVFSIPGAALEPLYKAVYEGNKGIPESEKITIVLTKHEQGSAFMADGYARVSGKLGVCWGTTGPGSTNLITGIASSFVDSIPILVMTAQVPTFSFGKGALQESTSQGVNTVDLFRYFTKSSEMLINPEKAGDMFRQALRFAIGGRRGPAHINIPVDLMGKKVDGKSLPLVKFRPHTRNFDRDAIIIAANLLLKARNPAMLLGNGTLLSVAAAEAADLSEVLSLPVATTPKAKGAFPEGHPRSLGIFGLAGSPRASDYLLNTGSSPSKVDVLLTVGTSFNEWGTYSWDDRLSPGKALIQVDIDPCEFGKNYPFEVELAGDAKAILRALALELQNQLQELPKKEGAAVKKKIGDRKKALEVFMKATPKYLEEGKMESPDLPLKPQRLMKDLRESLADDAIIFSDIGNNMLWTLHYLDITKPYSFFAGLGFAAMGYGVAAAVGAKFAAPDRPVVAIVGDGGFLMNGMEIATAVNYNKPVVWIVENNSELGMVSHGRKLMGLPYNTGAEFKTVDFVKIAKGLGGQGIRITKPGEINRKMMDKIFASGKPTVLDVRIDRKEVPPLCSRGKAMKEEYF